MLEDKLLIWNLKHGNKDSLRRIYEKYRDDLLRLATGFLNDVSAAEDVVQDVFISFAESISELELQKSLKGYLVTCVANRARNVNKRGRVRETDNLVKAKSNVSNTNRPEQWIICSEELKRLNKAIAQLPYEQREAVILHLRGEMTFTKIARLQDVSIKTTQSRYYYALDKLQSILNSETEK